MSTEMHVLAPISFYGETFKTKSELKEAIRETEKGRRDAEDALVKLIYMTEPKSFMSDDEDCSPEEWIDERIAAIKHDLEVAYVDLYKYNLLLEMWDQFHIKVDGEERTVTLPKEMRDKKPIWEHAYGEGDWIDPVYPDGTEIKEEDY